MSKELRSIPPTPRVTAPWTSALTYRWPLALLAFVFTVYGGLWTIMLLFASEGKPLDDARLDREASVAAGTAIDVRTTKTRIAGAPAVIVDFEFAFDPDRPRLVQAGASFAPEGPVLGGPVEIEFLRDAPHVNRVRGGRISLLGNFHTPAFFLTVVPGLAFLLCYLWGVAQTRRLLVHGDAAVAHVLQCDEVRYIQPAMLSVHFSFRDRRARTCVGHHWVRARSRLGTRLLEGSESVVVIHDRVQPGRRHRLVVADEFSRARDAAEDSKRLDARA